jgi:CIC family chloride channel protein
VVGGLAVGLLGWFVPDVLGVGYAHVGEALNGKMVLGMMALLLALKVVATATCYASGNAGGIFGPALFIGAMLGGTVGSLAHAGLPDITGSPGAYALVGMGTAFAGIVRAPMTSVIMIFEITRDYCSTSCRLSRSGWSIAHADSSGRARRVSSGCGRPRETPPQSWRGD